MHVDDIRVAIANHDRTAIRDAFRALVGFPYEGPIFGNGPAGRVGIGELMKALDAVCEAMEGDDTIVPRTTIDFINGRVTIPPIPGGSSYGEAAELVADQREQWRQGFLAHIAFHL